MTGLKDEWSYKRLDELGTVARGKSKHRPRNDPCLYGGKYPFIQTGDVKNADLYISKYSQTYNEKGLAQSKLWEPNTLCITIAANIAETALLKISACFPDSIVGFVANKREADVKFVKYYIDTIKLQMQNISKGTTQDNLSLDKLLSFKFLVPSLKTQQKIAFILSNYDDLIENNTRRIEILEQMAKLVYEEWFVKFRFPGHEKVKMVSSEFGEIPEGWEVKAFSEVINVNPPRKLSKGKLATRVSMADLNTWQSWINSWQKEEYKSGPKFKNGDTIFARITPSLENGKTAFVNFLNEGETAFGSTEFIVFGPKVIESGPYIFCLSRSEYVREIAITAMTGTSGRQRVPNDCFDHLLICVPPNNIVERFNEIVVPFFEMIKNYSKKSLCLKKTRDLLLSKLISGEIDVSDLDIRIGNEYQERNFNFGEPKDEKGFRVKMV